MALRMPSPTKHPKTGIYYLTVRSPSDLVRAGARPVLKESLRTKDPAEAKRRFSLRYEELQREWQAMRSGPAMIPFAQLVALAGEWRRELDAMVEQEPGETQRWAILREKTAVPDATPEGLAKWYGDDADRLLLRAALNADDYSRHRFIGQMHMVAKEWADFQHRRSEGDFRPDPLAERFPAWVPPTFPEQPPSPADFSITDAFKLWERDHLANGKPERTARDFRQKLDSLRVHVGHDDARKVTFEDIALWCDDLRHSKNISSRTVSQKYLAAAKVVFAIAVEKRKLTVNPAAGAKVRYTKPQRTRSPGFTDAEAQTILKAALAHPDTLGRRSELNKRAIRWGPWICAFTGARIGEVMQLRTEDMLFEMVGGERVPYLRITPEAGTVKTGRFRVVPVHPQLREMGLVEMIQRLPMGPVFLTAKGDPAAKARGASGKVGEWVREVAGIDDPRVQPNHAWKHRLKTIARDVDIAPEYIDAIQGHEDGRASSDYGETSIKALWREIRKLSHVQVG
ncbi:DUF6538 domain-containing protein [Paracoccus sp. (in: a-proteobacteria)]|uniref:DUF6538 domain-containing protein n=1 Tax=Paracoccus sp. TaxID=267 RepID=UPI00272D8EB4|nr:DUF6538 domain-containing protein [Paracoccus sp. (in: a-proteobacteria)]